MATIPAQVAGDYGVAETLSGYTLESFSRTKTPVREPVPDQYNRTAKEIRYDTRTEIEVVMRGEPEPSDATITVGDETFIVDNVQKSGIYNGLRRWTVRAHKTENCTAETLLTIPATQG